MPNRILRDWTDSERVNALSVHAERLFVRLIMKADDYGRLTAHPKLLRALLFPRTFDQVREADLSRWLAECEAAGLVVLYGTEVKPLLEIRDFRQRTRFDSKLPGPGFCETVERPPKDGPTTDQRPLETKAFLSEAEAQKKEENPPTPLSTALPFGLRFAGAWGQFIEHRRELRKPLTGRAEQMSIRKLSELSEDAAVRCIEDSIANGWQGLFPEKHKGNNGRTGTKGEAHDAYAARMASTAFGVPK